MQLNTFLRHVSISLVIILVAGAGSQSFGQTARSRYGSTQGGRSVTIPEDSVIAVRMDAMLTSRTAHVGDTFTVSVTVPVDADGTVIIPAGSIIEGRITQVTPAKRMSRNGSIAVEFGDLVLPDGSRMRLVGVLTSDDPRTRRRIDDEGRVSADSESRKVVFIGGGGALGAILGGIAGGGKGAAVGGALGAGVGLAGALLLKGEEAVVPSGTAFGVQLKQPLTIHDVSGSQRSPGIDQFPTQTDDPNTNDSQPPDPRSSDGTDTDPRQPDLRRTDRTVGDPLPSDPETSDRPPSTPDEAPSEEPYEPPPAEEEPPAEAEPNLPLNSPEMIRKAQIALKEQGYYEGETDGVMSPRTSASLKTYQRENKLPETGELDQQSANSLGLYKPAPASGRVPAAKPVPGRSADRPRDRSSSSPVGSRTDPNGADNTVLANVSSASASRTPDGGIRILINTQANTGGWRWFGDKVVNGDTLEVYARAVRPSGMVTQVLTRGRIELNVTEDVENVRRVVVHSNSGDQVIRLDSVSASAPAVDYDRPTAARSDASLQRQADDLLAYYQRLCGVRLTASGIEVDKGVKYGDAEIELLFAIDGFANAAQLYTRLTNSLRDAQSTREATLDLARQARRTDRVISTSNSRVAGSLVTRWDPIRQDVLKLMKNYNISASEIEND